MAGQERRQVVLVTGGGGGIGREIVGLFSRRGGDVALCDVSSDAVTSAEREFPGVFAACLDVTDPVSVDDFVMAVQSRFGAIDVLINNVGIPGPTAPIEDVSLEDWRLTIDVNVNSVYYFVRAVIPHMKARRKGCILNVSTASSRTGLPDRTPYIVSKTALAGFTLNLARELGQFDIRCNSVLPGAVRNERGNRIVAQRAAAAGISFEKEEESLLQHISMRSWVDPEEIAEALHFLASDRARHISGQSLGVCGNMEWE